MPSDEQDKAGVVAPPPLIYLGTLIFGLLLARRFPIGFCHARWRAASGCHCSAQGFCSWAGSKGPCASRHADQPLQAGRAHSQGRAVPLQPQPRLSFHGDDLHGHR
jgi:hypothetical protein